MRVRKTLLCKKADRRILLKLIPGVDFTYVLLKALARVDTKSAKDTDDLTVINGLLGSVHVKGLRKHVGEIDIWSQFHQHFTCAFLV